MTKKDKLKQAIKSGKIKTEKDAVEFVIKEREKEEIAKEVLSQIKPPERGEQGEQGIQGGRGEVGPQGLIGLQGTRGEIGLTGLRGEIGPVGPIGPVGERGFSGSPDTGEQIVDKINDLDDGPKIDARHIKNLPKPTITGLGSPAGALRMDGVNSPMSDISWAGYKITNLGTPTADADASTKKYVDDAVSGENLWDRTSTTLTPHTANDNLDMGSGNITTTGDLTIGNPTTPGAAGQSIFASQTYPVVDIIRDTLTATSSIFAAAKLERFMTGGTATNGSGIGFYFKTPDDAGNSTFAGMFGGSLSTVANGSEIGSIIFGAAWQGADPYTQNHLEVIATSATTGNVLIRNGYLKIGPLASGLDAQLVISDTTSKLFNAKFFTDLSNLNDTTGFGFGVHTGATKYMKSAIVHQRKDSWGKGELVFLVDAAATATDVAITDEVMRLTSTGALTLTGGGDFTTTGNINATTFNGAWNGSLNYVPYTGATTDVDLGNNFIRAGSSYYCIMGDDDNSKALYCSDGTRTNIFNDGQYGIQTNIGSAGNYGYYLYDDGSNYIVLFDGGSNLANYASNSYGILHIGDSSNSVLLYVDGETFLGGDNDKTYFGGFKDASITYDGTNLVLNPKEVGSGYLSVLGDLKVTGKSTLNEANITGNTVLGSPANIRNLTMFTNPSGNPTCCGVMDDLSWGCTSGECS